MSKAGKAYVYLDLNWVGGRKKKIDRLKRKI